MQRLSRILFSTLAITMLLVLSATHHDALAANCTDSRLRYVTIDLDAQRALAAAGVFQQAIGEAGCEVLQEALAFYDAAYGPTTGATYKAQVEAIKDLYPALIAAYDLKDVSDPGWPVSVPAKYVELVPNEAPSEWFYRSKAENLQIYTYRYGIKGNPPIEMLQTSLTRGKDQNVASYLQSSRYFRMESQDIYKPNGLPRHYYRQAYASSRWLTGLYVSYPDAPLSTFMPPDYLKPLIVYWTPPREALDAPDAAARNAQLTAWSTGRRLETVQLAELKTVADAANADQRAPQAIDDLVRRWAWRRSMSTLARIIASRFDEVNRWRTVRVDKCLSAKEDRTRRIVFATNRSATGTLGTSLLAGSWFNTTAQEDNQLTIGCASISTPAYDDVVDAAPVEARSSEQDHTAQASSTAFSTVKATQLAAPDVEQTAYRLKIIDNERWQFDNESRALVYVHGFNTSFETALFTAAQIAAATQYKGRVYLFSWPSAGRRRSYMADADSAERAEVQFTGFLRAIVADPHLKKIDVVAHSMGSQILTRALNDLLEEFYARDTIRLGKVILAAPDISTDVFSAKAAEISAVADSITVYGSATDRPLLASSTLRDSTRRLGLITNGVIPKIPGVTYIDATPQSNECNFWGYADLGHSYLTENPAVLKHMAKVLKGGKPDATLTSQSPNCWWRMSATSTEKAETSVVVPK